MQIKCLIFTSLSLSAINVCVYCESLLLNKKSENKSTSNSSYYRFPFEDFVPLSKSHLWKLSSAFYEHHGPQSWASKGVPNYVTSNFYIAKSYAKVLRGFLRDCIVDATQATLKINEPLYVIELGAGQGRFSYLFLKALEKIQSTLLFPLRKIVLVMTDASKSNFEAWQVHPSLEPYFDSGRLDAAIFNAAEDSSMLLHKSRVILKPGSSSNPVIIIANYLFDSLGHDLFRIANGALFEGKVSAGSQADETNDLLNPDIISRLNNSFKYEPTDLPFYPSEEGDESHWQGMLTWYLNHYRDRKQNATILFPVGALRALRRLSAFANQGALVVSADKGSGHVDSFLGLWDPKVGVDGCLSMMVNYHALSLWVNSRGGFSLVDPHEFSSLLVNVFVLRPQQSQPLDRMHSNNLSAMENFPSFSSYQQHPFLLDAYRDHMVSFSPSDFNKLVTLQQKRGAPSDISLVTIIAILRMVDWDPDVFSVLSHSLVERLGSAPATLQSDIVEGLQLVWQNYFVTDTNTEVIAEIGRIYGELSRMTEAAAFYRRYLNYHPKNVVALTNLGICLSLLGQKEAAESYLQLALSYRPSFELAREWLRNKG